MANPYHVERSWPDHFLEHRTRTVERQSMLVDDGIADDCDAVVELTADALANGADVTTTSGDDTAWSTLRSWLDLEVSGFHMHMR